MKTEFQIPPVLMIRTKPEETAFRIGSDRIYLPLSAGAQYENRIDLAPRNQRPPRSYPYKRDDESVN